MIIGISLEEVVLVKISSIGLVVFMVGCVDFVFGLDYIGLCIDDYRVGVLVFEDLRLWCFKWRGNGSRVLV